MGAVIESAVNWAVGIANDSSHGYDQNSRWGSDYDCSSLVIQAFEQAGCKVKSGGATYTGDMKKVFLKYGFSDVTKSITLSTGLGLKRGDVLLNTTHHTALVVEDGGKTIVNASINENGKATGGRRGDQTGREIYTRCYYNYPWNVVLRYNESGISSSTSPSSDKPITLSDKYGTGNHKVDDKFSVTTEETHKLIVGGNDISAYIGNLSWSNSIDGLATTMSFDVAKSNTRYVNTYEPKLGDIVNLYTNTEIFRGIIIAVNDGDMHKNNYTVTDFGWYLNKSTETYQFNNMNVKKAIVRICTDFNIPIDAIPDFSQTITQIYVDKCISDILSDILDRCGGGYNFDMTPRGIRIYKFGEIYAYPEFRITPNTPLIYSPTLRGNASHSTSIEDMKNSIKVVSEKDNAYTVQTVLKDTDSIFKYGILQEVVKIDLEKENANTVAKTHLAELNKPIESYSVEIIEALDSYTRAGSIISIGGVDYLIESTDHTIANGIHHNKMGLTKWTGLYRTVDTSKFETTSSSASSGSADDSTSKWVTGHTATTYGWDGDDNGICGWNGLNYNKISGCHVSIPTYCVKQAKCYNQTWAIADYPELANGYGTVLEVRSPDTGKTVKAVVADCGNFGKHNTYNHNTALDLPPNTFKALGLGKGTYNIEYRVVGNVSKWDGNQL